MALGASAGGLDAFTQFLIAVPPDTGMAFVLIQHLQPDHKSLLAQLLQRSTAMPVQEIADGCVPLANHVYVAPASHCVRLEAGKLRLAPNPGERSLHLPINAFFQSLAEERKGAAVAVVLSGNASDGTAGVAAVKAHGGICIAQSLQTATYDGMARSAIASGAVDYILAPDEIAREVARIARHPYLVASARGSTTPLFNPTQDPRYGELIALLHNDTGVDFAQYRTSTIGRRIARRMALRQIRTLAEYLQYVRENPGEVQLLFDDLLISATRFFRDPEVFDCLTAMVLPQFLAKRSRSRNAPALRMWSVGCATGEEAYSLAMIGLEAFEQSREEPSLQVFGTDLSEPAIRRARQGRYGPQIATEVSPARLERFFDRSETGFRVEKSLRDTCVFAQHHIAGEAPFSRLDLVSCRNLLIYMEPAMQHRVLPLLHFALNPGGVLVLGSAESAHEFSSLFEPIASGDARLKIYTKIDGAPHRTRFVPPQRTAVAPLPPTPTTALPQLTRLQARPSIEEADRIVLDLFGPSGVIVDSNLDIIQFRGATAPYLKPASGMPSFSLLKMAHGVLAGFIRAAVDQAAQRCKPVRMPDLEIPLTRGRQPLRFDLRVVPLSSDIRHHPLYLVLFEPRPALRSGGKRTSDPERARLRRALTANQRVLRSMIDEQYTIQQAHQAASEQLASANAELQSTNEELQTAKEELQSSNEELNTVNEELRHRNIEIQGTYADLTNLIAAVDLPIVSLDRGLNIRSFSAAAEKRLRLLPADIGRPIADIRYVQSIPNFEASARQAVAQGKRIEEVFRDRHGSWFQVRIYPTIAANGKIEGAVFTLTNADQMQRDRDQIASNNHQIAVSKAISAAAVNPLLLLDHHASVVWTNTAFQRAFSFPAEFGDALWKLDDGAWDSPQLREAIMTCLASGAASEMHLSVAFRGTRLALHLKRLAAPGEQVWILVALSSPESQRIKAASQPGVQ
ncbi:MAG TPA: chemotaxis protein CheB [Terriglobales bacterium]|nr:chemotaxis protein CheB [Terriglobales bacterium]